MREEMRDEEKRREERREDIKTIITPCLERVGSQFLHRWKGHEQEIRKR